MLAMMNEQIKAYVVRGYADLPFDARFLYTETWNGIWIWRVFWCEREDRYYAVCVNGDGPISLSDIENKQGRG